MSDLTVPPREPGLNEAQDAELAQAAAQPEPQPEPPKDPIDDVRAAREKFADWPNDDTKELAQPWDLGELGLPRPGVNSEPLPDGQPDTVSPVVPRAGLPLLSYGSQGDDVREIALRLGELGYANTVTRGQNPYGVYDESIHQNVEAFRRDYNVAEDPSAFVREPDRQAASHAGPWTLEAVFRVSDRKRSEAAA